MMTRKQLRELGTRLNIAAHGRHDDALTSPLWFSATELRLVADAMDILNYSQADGWTMRQRLDAFWRTGPLIKNAGSFAAYLHELPNGGVQ